MKPYLYIMVLFCCFSQSFGQIESVLISGACYTPTNSPSVAHDARATAYIQITALQNEGNPTVVAVFDLIPFHSATPKEIADDGAFNQFAFFNPKKHSSFSVSIRVWRLAQGVMAKIQWFLTTSDKRIEREFEKVFPLETSIEATAAGIPYRFSIQKIH